MTQDLTSGDLIRLFPDLARAKHSGARCQSDAAGQGRYVRKADCVPQFADVSIQARPAEALCVKLRHQWPATIPSNMAARLDAALLRGLMEAVLQHEPPAMGCELVTTAVVHHPDTTEMAVRIAASMAFQDMARKTQWTPAPPSNPKVA